MRSSSRPGYFTHRRKKSKMLLTRSSFIIYKNLTEGEILGLERRDFMRSSSQPGYFTHRRKKGRSNWQDCLSFFYKNLTESEIQFESLGCFADPQV
jgi:hypothetical protein